MPDSRTNDIRDALFVLFKHCRGQFKPAIDGFFGVYRDGCKLRRQEGAVSLSDYHFCHIVHVSVMCVFVFEKVQSDRINGFIAGRAPTDFIESRSEACELHRA